MLSKTTSQIFLKKNEKRTRNKRARVNAITFMYDQLSRESQEQKKKN